MPGKDEIVAAIRLEGEQEFKNGVTSVNKSITAMKSELSKVTAECEGQANSLESLSKKQEVLNKILDEQKKKVEATKAGLDNAAKSYENIGKGLDELYISQEKEINKLKEIEKLYGESSDEAKKQQQEVDKLSAAIDLGTQNYEKAGNHVNDWKTKLNTAEAQVIKATKAVNQNASYMKEAEEAADNCATSIDKFGKKTKEAEEITIGWGQVLKGSIVEKGLSMGTELLAEGVEKVKDAMIDTSKASAQLAASTGLSEAAAKRYEAVMKSIKGDNFGEDYQDVSAAMAEVIQTMGELSDDSMKEVTESAITLRDTFGMDVNESIRAADVMMKTMGVDASTAFDLITKGAQNGLNRSGELTDNLIEYSSLWGQAGFSASEMFGILENGMNSGAYNLDKVNDYVKEFGNSLADGRIEDNLDSFSDNTKTLFEAWKNGEASTSDVFYSVINDLSEMTNQQEALSLASEVWSALGEDNAMQVLTALDDVNEGYKNVHGAMESLKEVRYSDLESSLGNLGSVLQQGIITPIADKALPGITTAINAAAEGLKGVLNPPKTELEQFVEDAGEAAKNVEDAIKSADSIMQEGDDSAVRIGALGEQLLALNSIEEKSEAQKYRMKQVVDELSKSIPELGAAYDEQTGKVQLSDMAIRDLIGSTKELMMANAMQAAMQEEVNALTESTIALEKAKIARDSLTAESNYWDGLNQSLIELDILFQKSEMTGKDVEAFYQKLAGAQNSLKNALDKGTITTEEYNEAMKALGEDGLGWQQLMEVAGEKTAYYGMAAGEAAEETEKLGKANEEAEKNVENLETAIRNSTGAAEEEKDALKGNAEAADDTASSQENLAESTDKLTESLSKTQEAADAQKSAMSQIVQAYEGTKSEIESRLQDKISLFDMFDTEDGGEDMSVEQITKNLNSQIEAFDEYEKNLAEVKDHVGKEISPEFMQYLESMGMEGANTLRHIIATFEDEEPEKVKEMCDKWTEAMDQTEHIAEVGAANKTAYEMAMGELGSTETDFKGLEDSIEAAKQTAGEGWSGLSEATKTALDEVVQTAKDCGIKLPDGLAEGIASGEISAESAISQLNGTIQGTFDGLVKIAEESGIGIPVNIADGIKAGGPDAINAYKELLVYLEQQEGLAEETGKNAGNTTGGGVKTGMEEKQGEVEKTGSDMAQAAADAAESKSGEFRNAGTKSAGEYASGIFSAQSGAISAAGNMAEQAHAAVENHAEGFRSAGMHMSQGVAAGISAGASEAVNAAVRMMQQTLAAAKAAAEIHSPSRKFRREVGARIPEGAAFGIKDKTALAGKAAEQMSYKIYSKAAAWISKYRKSQETSISDEIYYWNEVVKHVKKGSAAYNKAKRQILRLKNSGTIAADLKQRIDSGFGVSAEKTTGSGKNKKQTAKSADEYNTEVLQAAEKALERYKILHASSLAQEEKYWQSVRKKLKKGTQAYYDVTETIKGLNSQRTKERQDAAEERKKAAEEEAEAEKEAAEAEKEAAEEEKEAAEKALETRADVQKGILEKAKVYNEQFKISAAAEAEYWNIARAQFEEGTDERIEADERYFEARQNLIEEQQKLDEEYAENKQKLDEELAESEKELRETYDKSVNDRKKDILSQMSLFEAWDDEGYKKEGLTRNLKTQVEGLKLWRKQLEDLSKKNVTRGLLDQLTEMGPEAAAEIYSLNTMTEAELEEYDKLWQERNDLANKQALKENEELLKKTEQGITDAKKKRDDALQSLKTDYEKAVADLNAGLSDGLKGLLDKAGEIGGEMVAKLVGGLKKATDEAKTAGAAGAGTAASAGTAAAPQAAPKAEETPFQQAAQILAEQTKKEAEQTKKEAEQTKKEAEQTEKEAVLKIINSGEKRSKKLTAKEKEEHSGTWEYIAWKYGRSLSGGQMTKLGDILGVKAEGKYLSRKEQEELLKVMKKKGYASGTGNITEDELAWLLENGKTEYILRKTDGAIMQPMRAGDKVVNPQGAENLYNFSMNPDDFLRQRIKDTLSPKVDEILKNQEELRRRLTLPDMSGASRLNYLMEKNSEPKATVVKVDNNGICTAIERTMNLMEEMVRKMENMQIIMYPDKVIGELQEGFSRGIAASAQRKNRGRIR